MHILLLNQAFYPDVVASAQYLTDFALALVERGHEVTVIASQRGYDNPQKRFASHEVWNGIVIHRIPCTGFGKGAKWKRACDFGSFLLNCTRKILTLPKADVVVALTSPPFISFLGALLAQIRGSRFVYWVLDLNPDAAIAAGWLNPKSILTRMLDWFSRFSLQHADKIIVLDRFMADLVSAKGIPRGRIEVIPPWSHDDVVHFDEPGRDAFRSKHGLTDKFVVMYSGNHSPCHPLDTLLEAALHFRSEPNFVFCFVGGGSEFAEVKQFATTNRLSNIISLPYQGRGQIAASLSSADLQVVVMGDPFVGTIHPCKIYNILSIGSPLLYIGPAPSHVTDIFEMIQPAWFCGFAQQNQVEQVVAEIRSASKLPPHAKLNLSSPATAQFSKETLLPQQVSLVECLVPKREPLVRPNPALEGERVF